MQIWVNVVILLHDFHSGSLFATWLLGRPIQTTFVQDLTSQRIACRWIADVMLAIRFELDLIHGRPVELASDPQPLVGGVISHAVVYVFV